MTKKQRDIQQCSFCDKEITWIKTGIVYSPVEVPAQKWVTPQGEILTLYRFHIETCREPEKLEQEVKRRKR